MKLLEKLIQVNRFVATIKRFPLLVLCALSLFVIVTLSNHNVVNFNNGFIERLCVVLGTSYIWFGITRLIAESQSLSRFKEYALCVLGMAGLSVLAWLPSLWWMHFLYLLPALLLAVMFAPYLKDGDDLSVCFFNRKIWFGFLLSYVALLLFAGGLCIALWAVNELFDVHFPSEIFVDIWAFSGLILGPIYALNWVPKRFTFKAEDYNDPPGLQFIMHWVSVPMVFIYLGILYVYFVKILVTGEVPSGYLAYMISSFVGVGIVTYLLAYPLREHDSPQLRLFYRVLFPAMIVPVAFHFYAIWERVSAYGVTESRYMLGVSALWFAFLAAAGTIKRLSVRMIPMSLAALMLVASVGPWSAISVSGESQKARLESLLVQNNILINGKIVKQKTEPNFEVRQNISSILEYMCQTKRDAMIESWFVPQQNDSEFQCHKYHLTRDMGFEFVGRYRRAQSDNMFNFSSQNRLYKNIGGYDRLIESIHAYPSANAKQGNWSHEFTFEDGGKFKAAYNAPYLSVSIQDMEPAMFDLEALAEHLVSQGEHHGQRDDMEIRDENTDMIYRLELHGFNGKIKNGDTEVHSFHFDFYYKSK